MQNSVSQGLSYLSQGVDLVKRKELRPFVLIPLTINLVLFSVMLFWGYGQVVALNAWLTGLLPAWLDWLTFLVWPLALLSALLFVGYGFSIIANLIASPFNGFLSEKAEQLLTGEQTGEPLTLKGAMALVPHAIGREFKKLKYYLPLLFLALLCYVVPAVNLVAPAIWFLLNAWMMSIQYLDYPIDNAQLPFDDVLKTAKDHRQTSLGFGGAVAVCTGIPLLNLFIMPVAICAATAMWVDAKPTTPKNDLIE